MPNEMTTDVASAGLKRRDQIDALRARMGEAIIGQREVIDRLPIGLLANGNLWVEGLPGLAKTRAIKVLPRNLECDFSRISSPPTCCPRRHQYRGLLPDRGFGRAGGGMMDGSVWVRQRITSECRRSQ
jgi:hypothetical protein